MSANPMLHDGMAPPSTVARRYMLGLLTLTAVVNYLDRQILGILLPAIKGEFSLSDWQLGLLTGPAFSIVFVSLSIPLAVLADRTNRKKVIVASVFLFSLMTIACGKATGFAMLCAARLGVGVGEAGTLPATNSLIADLYPPEKRASAVALYISGSNIGMLIAFFAGGLIVEAHGWRTAFFAAGIPGLIIALLLWLTTSEPPRRASGPAAAASAPTLVQTFRYMWRKPALRWLMFAAAAATLTLAGSMAFTPLFLVQAHGLSPSHIGYLLALTTGLFGAAATWLVGIVNDRAGRSSIGAMMIAPAIASGIMVPTIPIFFLAPALPVALAAGIAPMVLGLVFTSPGLAIVQLMVPPEMRAKASAILVAFAYLFGTSMGPLMVGGISDLLGAGGLRIALSLTAIASGISALAYWRVHRLLRTTPRPAV